MQALWLGAGSRVWWMLQLSGPSAGMTRPQCKVLSSIGVRSLLPHLKVHPSSKKSAVYELDSTLASSGNTPAAGNST